jgi:hypothetical protein
MYTRTNNRTLGDTVNAFATLSAGPKASECRSGYRPTIPSTSSPVSPPSYSNATTNGSTKPAIGSGPNDGIGSDQALQRRDPVPPRRSCASPLPEYLTLRQKRKRDFLPWYRQECHWGHRDRPVRPGRWSGTGTDESIGHVPPDAATDQKFTDVPPRRS